MSINYAMIGKILGGTLLILSLAICPCLFLAFWWNERVAMRAFLLTLVILLPLAFILLKKVPITSTKLRTRDAIFTVACIWIFSIVAGTFPYELSGFTPSYADALFESTSAFTTTGGTIFRHPEQLPRSLLFWRSLCQLLGSFGLILLTVSFHPILGARDQSMGTTETPESSITNFTSHFSHTARILCSVYGVFTALCILLLLLSGLSGFDAFTFAFGSISSGGLTPYSDGVMHLKNPTAEGILSLFSIISCVNFTLYFTITKRRLKEFSGNLELRVFLGILIFSSILVIGNLRGNHFFDSLGDSIRHGTFQVISFMTTTGNYTCNFYNWPSFSKFLLFTLAFIGGCAASTSGGIKISRILIMCKTIMRGLHRRVHPHAVFPMKLQGHLISFDIISNTITFISTYFGFFLFGCLVISLENFDLLTTISTSASMLGNLGAGFGEMGLNANYSMFSNPGKLFLSLEMLVGRLELFIILLLFTPRFWNPDK